MKPDVKIVTLHGEPHLINIVATWYKREWGTSPSTTAKLVKAFQILATENGTPVGTAGLYTETSLLRVYPQYRKYSPWLAMLYVAPEKRCRGIGTLLCNAIEEEARRRNHGTLYLYTFTAEPMYRKLGWNELERVDYKGHDTVIMSKDIR